MLVGLFLVLVMLLISVRAVRSVQVTMKPATVSPPPPRAPIAPNVPQRFTLAQRRQVALAGTNGTVFVHVGDITGGQMLLTLQDSAGVAMMPSQLVREGDLKTFPIAGSSFDIEVIELINHLTGDDFATLEIRRAGFPRATTRPAATRSAD